MFVVTQVNNRILPIFFKNKLFLWYKIFFFDRGPFFKNNMLIYKTKSKHYVGFKTQKEKFKLGKKKTNIR